MPQILDHFDDVSPISIVIMYNYSEHYDVVVVWSMKLYRKELTKRLRVTTLILGPLL